MSETRILGKTGLRVGRLGVASSYGVPTEAVEEAFERGCNYFWWSWKRSPGMGRAIRNICGKGQRDRLVIMLQSYSRSAMFLEHSVKRALRLAKLDYADGVILGWHRNPPSRRLIDRAYDLKNKGLIRNLGLSGHNRKLFPKLAETGAFDFFHIRYNAAHRGAETETFPYLRGEDTPGVVTYTATRWGHLLQAKRMPDGEKPLRAADCYRFVLANPDVDVCMTGVRSHDQMKQALVALDEPLPTRAELERMRKIGDHIHGGVSAF